MVLVTMSCKRFYEIYLVCYENGYFSYNYDDILPAGHNRLVLMLNSSKDYQVFPLEEVHAGVPPFFLEGTFKKIERLKIYE